MEFETVDISQLNSLTLALTDYFAHAQPNGQLYKSTINDLAVFIAPYVSNLNGSPFVPFTGTVLPNPISKATAITFVSNGTFTQTTGGSVTTTQPLNVLFWTSSGTTGTWTIGIEIPINLSNYYTKAETAALITALNIPNVVKFGVTTPTSVGAANATINTYIFNQPQKQSTLSRVKIQANASGTLYLKRFQISTDGLTLNYMGQVSVSVVAGLNDLVTPSIAFSEGDLIGFYSTTPIKFITNGEFFSLWRNGAVNVDITSNTLISTLTNGSSNVSFQLDFYFDYPQWSADMTKQIAANTEEIKELNYFTEPFTYGVNTPVTGSNASPNLTYIFDEKLDGMVFKSFSIYSAVGGVLTIKRVNKNGNTYTLKDSVNFITAVGLNTFDLPYDMVMARGDKIAVFSSILGVVTLNTTNNFYNSFVYFNGNLTTSTTTVTPSINQQLQVYFVLEKLVLVTPAPDALLLNNVLVEDFTGATIPDTMMLSGTAWTYSGGKAIPGAIGVANALQGRTFTNISKTYTRIDFTLNDATAHIALFNRPVTFAQSGSIATVNIANNKLTVYNNWNGTNTLPTVLTDKVITFTLVQGRTYRLECIKDKKDMTFNVIDMVTLALDTISLPGGTQSINTAGYAYGRPGAFAFAGSVSLDRIQHIMGTPSSPLVGFYGDSISEGYGMLAADCYTYRALAVINGFVSAQASCTTADVLERLVMEITIFKPKYVHILIGTNETVEATWLAGIDAIYAFLTSIGVIPVFGCIPANAQNPLQVTTWNADLIAKGYRVVRYDLATTLNNDGATINNALFQADQRHPNASGGLAMFNRLKMDLPEIFI